MSVQPIETKQPFSGYQLRNVPEDDWDLAHTGPNTPLGEYFRRHWNLVSLSSRVMALPVAIRAMGEDLVVFRDKSGTVGVLHRPWSSLRWGGFRLSGREVRRRDTHDQHLRRKLQGPSLQCILPQVRGLGRQG